MVRVDLSRQTGNFWIDNGLVVLYQRLGEGEFPVGEVLQMLVQELTRPTGNTGEYFDPETQTVRTYEKESWVRPADKFIKSNPPTPKINYTVDSGVIIGEIKAEYINSSVKGFLLKLESSGGVEIDYEKTKAKIVFEDIQKLPLEFSKYLLSKLQKKKSGQIYISPPPKRMLKIQFKGSGTCDICGAVQPLADAKMWMFPFVVEPGKFGNFYPGVKRGLKLCPRCALAGLAGYLAWLWRAQGRYALHIFLFHTDLRALDRLHRTVLRPLREKNQAGGGNVPLPFWGPYLNESTLALLLELFSHVDRSDLLPDDGRRLLAEFLGAGPAPPPAPLQLYTITGTPGQAFHMTGFREFSRFHELYRLYRAWKNLFQVDNPHDLLVQVFRQFQTRQNRQYETLWRDRIAWSILEFQDPFPFVEDFLFDARAREKNPGPMAFGTLDVFGLYAKEVLKMEEQFLKTLASFGHNLGRTAHEKNEMGLLYALRNAKNADEFFKVLNDIQFRLELDIPEVFLAVQPGEKIQGSLWKRVKTLLSIFAMNAYLWAQQKAQKKEEVNA